VEEICEIAWILLQGLARFLPFFITTAMSLPIRNSYERRIYKYDHFPEAQYVHQIMPFHKQNRVNYIAEENIYNTNVLRTEQEEPKDSQCKYYDVFNKVCNVKANTFV